MAIDLDQLSATRRKNLITIGEHFPSDATHQQAGTYIKRLTEHPEVYDFGVEPEHAEQLTWLRSQVAPHSEARSAANVAKRANNSGFDQAMRGGKVARQIMLPVLAKAERGLRDSKVEGDEAVANDVEATLARVKRAGADPVALDTQLASLAKTLDHERVKAFVAPKAYDTASGRATAARAKLAPIVRSTQRGTPTETAAQDLIDGLIVETCREIRGFARAAALDLGRPDIAKAFELRDLYPSRRAASGGEGGGGGGGEGGGGEGGGGEGGGGEGATTA